MKLPGEEAYPNQAPNTPVNVTSVVVEGGTIFPKAEIDGLTDGLIGPATPASAIEAARLAILRKYRDDGYPLVTVSAALARNGALRFVVVEGRISDVKLEGDIGPAGTKVLQFLGNLIKDGPTKTSEIERWLLLAQDVPGVGLQTVLRPSEADPGSLVLIARVTRTPISGFVVADNRAFKDTGPVEVLGVVGYNSVTSLGERSEVSIYKSVDGLVADFRPGGCRDVRRQVGPEVPHLWRCGHDRPDRHAGNGGLSRHHAGGRFPVLLSAALCASARSSISSACSTCSIRKRTGLPSTRTIRCASSASVRTMLGWISSSARRTRRKTGSASGSIAASTGLGPRIPGRSRSAGRGR